MVKYKRRMLSVAMVLCGSLGIAACGTSSNTAANSSSNITVADGTGAKISVPSKVTRVVALDGSAAVSMKELGLSPKGIAYGQSNKLLIDQVFGSEAKTMTATGGSWEDPNVEDITAFNPGLVIGDDGEGSIGKALKGVAPSISSPLVDTNRSRDPQ